ncbi:MAG: prephenate dehydrogenase/arogenate dehydrogenase family protein [Acidobacteriota bacterium]
MTVAAVVGLGLIGGSIALGLDAPGWDEDPAAREAARRRGIHTGASLEETVAGARVVFAAVPTAAVPEVLRWLAGQVPGSVLTDAASLKMPVLAAAAALPAGIRFVGGHPMAGSATLGIAGAAANLFAGRPWLVVPGASSDPASITLVREQILRLGATPISIEAEQHDAAMTWISHLPMAVSAALAQAVARELGERAGALAGPGLSDTTRLAGSRPELALELWLSEPRRLAAAVRTVSNDLKNFAAQLENEDRAAIEAFLREAGQARKTIHPNSEILPPND